MTNTPEDTTGSPARSADDQDVQDGAAVAQLVSPIIEDTEDAPAATQGLSDPDDQPAATHDDDAPAADPNDVILDPAITGGDDAAAATTTPSAAVHADPSSPAFVNSEEALATLASLSAQDSAQGLKRRMSGSPGGAQEGPIKYTKRDDDPSSPRRQDDKLIDAQAREPASTSDNMLRSPVMAMPVHYQHISPAMVAHAQLPPDHNPYASSASAMFQSGVNQLAQAQSPTESQPAGTAYFPNYANSGVPYDSPYSGNQQTGNLYMQGYTSSMPPNSAGLGLESGRPHMDRSVSHEENMRMSGGMDMAGGQGLMNSGIGGSGYGGESSIRGNGITESAFDMYNPQDQVVHDLNASDSLLNLHAGGMYPGSLAGTHHGQDLRSATLQSPAMQMGAQMEQPPHGSGDEFSPVLGGANAKARDEKQRKRIIQACEPCRIRKAKCNGLQPCGRCGQRGLPCIYASERRMRGPNKVKKSQTEKEQANRERQQRKAAERHAQDLAALNNQGMPHHHVHPHHQHSTMIDDDIQIPTSAGPIDGMRQPFSPSDPRGKDDAEMGDMNRSLLSAYDASNGNPNSASLHQHGQLLSNWPGSGFNMGPQHYMEGMSTSSSRDYDRSDRTTDQRMFYGNHPVTPGTGGQADFGGQYQLGGYAGGPGVSASPPNQPQPTSYPREYYPQQGKTHRSPLISGERELDYAGVEEGGGGGGGGGGGATTTTMTATPPYAPRFADSNMQANLPTHHTRTGSNADLNTLSSVRGVAEHGSGAQDSHLRSSSGAVVMSVGSGGGGEMDTPGVTSGNGTPSDRDVAGGRSSIAGMLLGDLTPHEDTALEHEPTAFPEE